MSFVGKFSSFVKDGISKRNAQKFVSLTSKDSSNISKVVDLNISPANIYRSQINNLSSKFLLKKGKSFVPKDINFDYHSSVGSGAKVYHRFLDESVHFKPEYNAKELPLLSKKLNNVFIVDNNISPHGSISISKSFDEPIMTTGLLQCAALAIVDTKEKVQTLLHFCPTTVKQFNDELLDYLLKFGNTENLKYTIVPGAYSATDNTIGVLVDKIMKKRPNANIQFKYFPENSSECLVLKNGELFSAESKNILSRIVNPIDDICYASIPTDIMLKKVREIKE